MRRPWEALLVLPTTFSHAINWFLKAAAESPRPTAQHVRITDPSAGFGFPSGHTMATVVFCGVIIYLAWRVIDHRQLRLAVQALAVAVVLGIGFSRIYSGAHWPSDVLGGIMWGAFYTAIMVVIFHRFRPMPRSHSRMQTSGELAVLVA
jgi:undecaprenyl-diphosphatase